jgi:3'-phosphoadenosine 5'-phosphosulfate (PAPS) 3'-phosphatase
MSFAEKAGQTRVMVTRVRERASRVEARLAEARRSGDAADIHLQEVLLQRLRQRTTQLAQQAEHEEEQAVQEASEASEEAEPSSEPGALEQDPSQVP